MGPIVGEMTDLEQVRFEKSLVTEAEKTGIDKEVLRKDILAFQNQRKQDFKKYYEGLGDIDDIDKVVEEFGKGYGFNGKTGKFEYITNNENRKSVNYIKQGTTLNSSTHGSDGKAGKSKHVTNNENKTANEIASGSIATHTRNNNQNKKVTKKTKTVSPTESQNNQVETISESNNNGESRKNLGTGVDSDSSVGSTYTGNLGGYPTIDHLNNLYKSKYNNLWSGAGLYGSNPYDFNTGPKKTIGESLTVTVVIMMSSKRDFMHPIRVHRKTVCRQRINSRFQRYILRRMRILLHYPFGKRFFRPVRVQRTCANVSMILTTGLLVLKHIKKPKKRLRDSIRC